MRPVQGSEEPQREGETGAWSGQVGWGGVGSSSGCWVDITVPSLDLTLSVSLFLLCSFLPWAFKVKIQQWGLGP